MTSAWKTSAIRWGWPAERLALHRLIGIHDVQAGRVETGQPHVPHDYDAEGVLAILEPSRPAGGETDCQKAARRANSPWGGG